MINVKKNTMHLLNIIFQHKINLSKCFLRLQISITQFLLCDFVVFKTLALSPSMHCTLMCCVYFNSKASQSSGPTRVIRSCLKCACGFVFSIGWVKCWRLWAISKTNANPLFRQAYHPQKSDEWIKVLGSLVCFSFFRWHMVRKLCVST